MARQSILSLIGATEADVQKWAACASLRKTRVFDVQDLRESIDCVVAPEDREWFHKTLEQYGATACQNSPPLHVHDGVKAKTKSATASIRGRRTDSDGSLENYLNKPLPLEDAVDHAVPGAVDLNKPLPPLPQQPYFEYLFVDAVDPGVKGPPADGTTEAFFTLEKSGQGIIDRERGGDIKLQHVAVARSPKEVAYLGSAEINNFAVAQAGVDIVIDGCGLDKQAGAAGESIKLDFTPAPSLAAQRSILQPKSQKAKAQKAAVIHPASGNANAGHAPALVSSSLGTVQKVTKRGARPSFATRSVADAADALALPAKKVRPEGQQADEDVAIACADVIDRGVDGVGPTDDIPVTKPLFADRPRKPLGLNGYPGQFKSREADFLRRRAARAALKGKKLIEITFGDPIHPNNEFTHTNFIADPTWPATDLTQADINEYLGRTAALCHAADRTTSAEKRFVRTASEEDLRREGQRECALARLEGVMVGQYRYYQGHLSLEDYKQANMCICWSTCWCSKLCTIYGDVLCPCNGWIVMHKD